MARGRAPGCTWRHAEGTPSATLLPAIPGRVGMDAAGQRGDGESYTQLLRQHLSSFWMLASKQRGFLLQRGLLSLSPLPPCPCRLRTPGSGSRQLSVCVTRLLACSQGHPCRQHPPDHGWVVPPLLPFVHHLSSHAWSFSSLSQARGVNPLARQPRGEE